MKNRWTSSFIAISVFTLLALLVTGVSAGTAEAVTQHSGYYYGDADRSGGDLTSMDVLVCNLMVRGDRAVDPAGDCNRDGKVSSMDILFIGLTVSGAKPQVSMLDANYDFSENAGTSRWAKSKSLSELPPVMSGTFDTEPAGWVEATEEEYLNISEEYTTAWTITASSYAALQCKFTVDEKEDAGDITSIGVYFNGSSEVDGDILKFWAWNFADSEWNQIGSGVALTTTCNSYHSGWTSWGKVFSNYIDSTGRLYILIVNTASSSDLHVNYIRLEIATPTPFIAPTPTETVGPTVMPTATPTTTVTVDPTPTATLTAVPTATPTQEYCQETYNYVGVTRCSGPHDAYYCSIRNMPPPRWLCCWLKNEASNSEYAAIAASDDARWQTPNPGRKNHALVTFEMVIDEVSTSLSKVDLVFEGQGEADSDFEIWAYNYATGKGERIGKKMHIPAGSDSTMVRSITDNCGDYISPDGKVIWGVYQKATTDHSHHSHHWFTDGYWMAIDYVELVTTYDCP